MCFREDALAGRHIVISGGCGAIGLGIVKKLTEHGAKVAVNDILDTATAETRLRDAEIDLENIVYVQADLTRAEDVETLVATAQSTRHFAMSAWWFQNRCSNIPTRNGRIQCR